MRGIRIDFSRILDQNVILTVKKGHGRGFARDFFFDSSDHIASAHLRDQKLRQPLF